MSIERFADTFGHLQTRPISEVFEVWAAETQVDKLMVSIDEGLFTVQMLSNEDITHGGISKEVLDGFLKLMKKSAVNRQDVRDFLMKQARSTPHALQGSIAKIQGQIGENAFVKHAGSVARLAKSGSQEGWDIAIKGAKGHADRYVQVKVYHDANKVLAEIQKVEAKCAAGKILDGKHVVRKVDFAVNDDIADKVRAGVKRLKLHTKVESIGRNRESMRRGLEHASSRYSQSSVQNYLSDILKGALVGTALVAATNGFLLWNGNKELDEAVEDTVYGSAVAFGGVASVVSMKAFLTLMTGPIGLAAGMGVGYGARAVMERFFSRRHLGRRLTEDNTRLQELCDRLEAPALLPVGVAG